MILLDKQIQSFVSSSIKLSYVKLAVHATLKQAVEVYWPSQDKIIKYLPWLDLLCWANWRAIFKKKDSH